MFDFAPDTNKVREIEIDDNVVYMKRFDPFGFIRVSFKKGQPPKTLQGDFTSYDEADKKLNSYLASKGKTILRDEYINPI